MKKAKGLIIVVFAVMLMSMAVLACQTTYVISFKTNGGNDIADLKFDKNFVLPTPEKPGFKFEGWYYDDQTWQEPFTEESAPAKNITLYAKWAPYFTVSFRDWDSTLIPVNGSTAQEVVSGENAIAPAAPVREGYTFTGWSAAFTNVTANLTITAQYSVNKYTLSFSSDGEVFHTQNDVAFGTDISSLVAVKKLAYVVEGWYSEEEFENKVALMPARNVTVYANWVYVGIEGLGISSNKTNNTLAYGESVTLSLIHNLGDLELEYQWYQANTILEGKTQSSLTVAPDVNGNVFKVKVTSAANNYEETASITLTVNKKTLTVTAGGKSINYGDEYPSFGYYTSGFISGETESVLSGSIGYDCVYTKGSGAGTYDIIPKGFGSNNYNIIYVKGTLTVNKINLSIKANDTETVYGDECPSFTHAVTGFIIGETESVLSGSIGYDCVYTKGSGAGTYDIIPKGFGSNNYNIVYVKGTLTVNKANLYVEPSYTQILYGDDLPSFSSVITGFVLADTANDLSGTLKYDCDYKKGDGAGNYVIIPKGLNSNNYSFIYVSAILSVGERDLFIKAHDANINYGDDLPLFSYYYETGFVLGETENVLSGRIVYACDYKKGDDAGKYAIIPSGLTSSNYNIIYQNGILTVNKANLSIRLNTNKVYDGEAYIYDDWSSDVAAVSGLVDGHNITGSIYTENAYTGIYISFNDYSLPDGYGLNLEIAVKDGNDNNKTSNFYIIYYLRVTIEDNPIPYVVKDYIGTYNGQNHDISSSVIIGQTESQATVKFSLDNINYFTNPLELNLSQTCIRTVHFRITADNYNPTDGVFVVTIKKAFLLVTINNVNITYGQTPQFTASFEGFVNNENESALGGNLVFSGYNEGQNAGTYNITAKGLMSHNYDIFYRAGTLSIAKANYSSITHEALSGAYSGKTLADFELEQYYKWADENTIPTVGTTKFLAIYNADYVNYNDFELNITITLTKGTLTIDRTVLEYDLLVASSNAGGVTTTPVAVTAKAYNENQQEVNVELTYSQRVFNVGGTYLVEVSLQSELWTAQTVSVVVKIKSVKLNDALYTIEDALNIATAGKVVIVTTNTQFASEAIRADVYNGDSYYTVKTGVTLLVPYGAAYSNGMGDIVPNAGATYYFYGITNSSAYVTLTLNNVVLDVYGTLNVNGNLGAYGRYGFHGEGIGGGTPGHMGNTVDYGMLVLNGSSTVNVKNAAVLNSTGFIAGQGEVIAENGSSVYDVFQILDYRGGTASNNLKNYVLPFNQYAIQNVEAKLTIHYGASYYARYFVYTSSNSATGNIQIAGSGNRNMFQLQNGYLVKTYDYTYGTTTLDFFGNVTFNYMELKIQAIVTVSIDSSGKETPLPGNFRINVKNGTTFTVATGIKLLPGAKIHVEQGAAMVVNKGLNLFVYAAEQYTEDYFGESAGYPARNTSLRNKPALYDYSKNESGYLIIDGTITVNGNIAGPVITAQNATVTINGNTTITIIELSPAATGNISGQGRMNLTGTYERINKE